MPNAKAYIILLFALSVCVTANAKDNPDPKTQADVYLWKAPFTKPTIAPYVDVGGYRFVLTEAGEEISKRIKADVKKDLPGRCGYNVPENWPIYQYDLGKDGHLFMVSCTAASFDSSSVYVQRTPQNKLKLLRFQTPVLNGYSKNSHKIPPKIIGYRALKVLKNSQIVQRRVVSDSSSADSQLRHFWGEWIWKEGHGFTLMKYAFMVYDKNKKGVRKTNLYP
jgi:hypothetical protein